jgi:hypothetical protein
MGINRSAYISGLISVVIFSLVVPVLGLNFWGWRPEGIIAAFWLETVIVGIWTIFKITLAQNRISKSNRVTINGLPAEAYSLVGQKIQSIMLLLFHFSLFITGFGLILWDNLKLENLWKPETLLMASGIFISHGISFSQNYIATGKYKNTNPFDLIISPYSRIILLIVLVTIGTRIGVAIVTLIILKTLGDLIGYQIQHGKLLSTQQSLRPDS